MKRTIFFGGVAISLLALLGAGCAKSSTPKTTDEKAAVETAAPSADGVMEETAEATSTDAAEGEVAGKNETGLTQQDLDALKADLQSMQADDVPELAN
ncbi:hypothetical protein KKF59_03455 [Patescibacteria group bacterium]|nr:hypothetical protein [Patescibacteria group bacterium]MBU1034429.1 hypothetical protein [Patescibacteria group bacterium]MBU1629898.1 hypothetical protein [Patescibacteria group bacterium]MBU1908158.1 hypothetical protein [Patescibacteria group bacterium]